MRLCASARARGAQFGTGGGRAVCADRAVLVPAKVSYDRAVVGEPAVAFYKLAAVGLPK